MNESIINKPVRTFRVQTGLIYRVGIDVWLFESAKHLPHGIQNICLMWRLPTAGKIGRQNRRQVSRLQKADIGQHITHTEK